MLHRHTGQADPGGDASFADLVARCAADDPAGTGADAPLRLRLPRTTAEIEVTAGPAELVAAYPPDLPDAGAPQRLLDQLATALAGGLAAPGRAVANIDLLPPAERELLLHTWNPPAPPYRAGLLHEVVAGHDPDRVAVRCQGAELTYRELEQRSNQLAHALHEHGIRPGHLIGLLLDRGPHLVIAELAVLKAGAAWLPLDPQLPPARLAFMTADAAVPLVLTTTDLAGLAPDTTSWCLDERTFDGPDTAPGSTSGRRIRPT